MHDHACSVGISSGSVGSPDVPDLVHAPAVMTPRRLLWSLLVVLLTACAATSPAPVSPGATRAKTAAAPRAKAELVAIDMFGTKQITLDRLLAIHGTELRAFTEALMRGDPSSANTEALLDKLYALGDFADVTPALVGMYAPGGMKYYLTLDFVDRADAARRMPFVPSPTGTHDDPDGLLADWRSYESLMYEKPGSRRVDCAAFHCIGDDAHPEMKRLASTFVARVPAHVEALATILRDDKDGQNRAAAAYLLAYSKDGASLVKLLVPAFRDGSGLVRNNAMRVVADIATYHPNVEVPIEPVLEALSYPATLDRNKAAAILDGLLARPGSGRLHRLVARRAGATLLAMLRLQQPNNHDFAYRILKVISGQDFGERDYSAWEGWLRAQAEQ